MSWMRSWTGSDAVFEGMDFLRDVRGPARIIEARDASGRAYDRLAQMPLMLPPAPETMRSITGVASEVLASVRGESTWLPGVRSAVLLVIDGLGAISLRAHAGHARRLASGMAKKDVASSVFPTTTAAALTSLLTGVFPGEHGLVGYRVRDPQRDVLVNQLSDWDRAGIDASSWQTAPTIFERARDSGHPAFVVGMPKYASTGFSAATLRGADFYGAVTAAERAEMAWSLAAEHPGSIVYCYMPEVDQAGHKFGIDSAQWVAALEDVDAALADAPRRDVGVLITADHGMIDVPTHRQVVLEPTDGWHDGVRHIGGEPRMLHVYLEHDADAAEVRERWSGGLAQHADVVSRKQAIASGLFGAVVTEDAAPRIGDFLVVARGNRAIYDGGAADQHSRGMIGQHGALTDEEWRVPLIRAGAYRT